MFRKVEVEVRPIESLAIRGYLNKALEDPETPEDDKPLIQGFIDKLDLAVAEELVRNR